MVRRLSRVVALAAIALLVLPTVASADQPSRLVSPENGTVTGPLEIRFEVDPDPRVGAISVRLASGGDATPTSCKEPCSRSNVRTVAFDLAPSKGAPFAEEPLPNGPLNVELIGAREVGGDVSLGVHTLQLRVPSAGVRGLAVTTEERTVRLAWRRAPEPDVERYRIERCTGTCADDGRWEALRETQASASSYTDEPGTGEFSYRVVTNRSTGGDGTLETVSSPVVAEVAGDENGDGNGNGEGNGDGNGDDDGASDGNGNGSGDRRERSEPPRITSRERSRGGDAPSMSVERSERSDPAGEPEVADVFEPELDYSSIDPRTRGGQERAATDGSDIDDEVIIGAPGDGDDSFLGALTDPDRIAVPIAGGLLMTTVGLHLWRWRRLPIP